MNDTYFTNGIDVDTMLYNTAKWLVKQVNVDTEAFVKIASALDLRQEDWDTFWKTYRAL